MANRSYLYVADELPGGPVPLRDLSEWNWAVPIVHRVLLTGSPRLVPSATFDPPTPAIVGDYDTGVANLERFLAALPPSAEVRAAATAALTALHDPRRRGRYLVLEIGEILALSVDDDDDPAAFARSVAEAAAAELAEVGGIDSWLRYAPQLTPEQLPEATGAGHWPAVLFHSQPPAPAVPPAYVMPQPPPPTGAVAWGLGLIALVPFPVVASLAAGLVMVLVGRGQRRLGPQAAANGRAAGNWGFTYLLASVALWATHFVLLYALTKDGPSSDFFPLGIAITVWAALTLAHLVICAVGLRRAGRGGVLRVPALPLLDHAPPR